MRRKFILVVAGLFAFGGFVSVILILPPVQRWLVLSALESPDMTRAEIGRVRIRPGSVLIENLLIEKQGMRLAFDRAMVRGSLWRAAYGGDVHLRKYELSGLYLAVDVGETGRDDLGNTLVDAAVVLAPFAFELDHVDLNGVLEVRMGPERLLAADLIGQGGGYGGSKMGQLNLTGEVSGEAMLADPVPLELEVGFRRVDGFRRIESSLKGVLGGDEPIAEFTTDLSYENAVFEADGDAAFDFQQIDELLVGTGPRRLSSGKGELQFKWAANASGESVSDGLIVVTDLVSAVTGYRIERIKAPFRVAVAPGTSLSLRAPVEVQRTGFESDVLVGLTAVADEPNWRLDGMLSGDQIRFDDLAGLGVFFTGISDPSDPAPAWGGLRGRLGLDFERVEIQPGLDLQSLTTEIEFADLHVGIRDFSSTMGGGVLTGDATLGYDPSSDEPYDLDGSWTGKGIRLEKLGSVATNPAVIEGRFDLDLSVHAKAIDLRRIADRMSGIARFSGGPGVYRGLSNHARSAASVAGILGTLFRSENLQAISELSNELEEIHYDTIEMEATQSVSEGLEVSRMLLQGSEVKMYGRGRVMGSRPAELMESPMRFDFTLGAKGRLADLLGLVGLTSNARRDWEGYTMMSEPFTVRGTPENPDFSELWGLLRGAAVNAVR